MMKLIMKLKKNLNQYLKKNNKNIINIKVIMIKMKLTKKNIILLLINIKTIMKKI